MALVALGLPPGGVAQAEPEAPVQVLLRADDVGLNHAVNAALAEMVATGLPFSASVMVPCPWFLEAAEILRDQPQVSVGIHLTLNSEWQHYKWGPVLGAGAVPSLVDANGHFHTTAADFAAAEVDLEQVKRELEAQIRVAREAGLEIDYLDYHMLTALSTPELRQLVESLAAEHGLGLSRYFGERSTTIWAEPPERKLAALLDFVARVEPGAPNLMVLHLALDTPEMEALVDVNNPRDPYRAAVHRQAELDAVTSPAFRSAVEGRNLRLLTYGELIAERGLEEMRPPSTVGYSMGDGEEPDREDERR